MCRDNHLPEGKPVSHYIDCADEDGNSQPIGTRVQDETGTDNNRRPGRYLMLQRVETLPGVAAAFGYDRMKSSLNTARILKEKVGSEPWAKFVLAFAD